MITCFLKYEIDPDQVALFEQYARLWIPLVKRFGGDHHGYFLPSEGANDIAYALFSFPSLAEYEKYRQDSFKDEACLSAFQFAKEHRFIRRYERSFLSPILSSDCQES